jgi:hypothetical protein
MSKKTATQWQRSDMLVRRMFDLDWVGIVCPYCDTDKGPLGIAHMDATIFGATEAHRSGPGLIIFFHCEDDHKWMLRFSDHSGQMGLSIEKLKASK